MYYTAATRKNEKSSIKKNIYGGEKQQMPGGDRTGPLGQGPMTGRRAGFCTGNNAPGYNNGPPMGLGRGFGRGRGFRNRRFWNNYPEPTQYPAQERPIEPSYSLEQQKQQLEQSLQNLEEEIRQIKQRLTDITKQQHEQNP